jgi:arginase
MPAVDYRMPGGLSFEELTEVLQVLMTSPKAIGLEITIFNPSL